MELGVATGLANCCRAVQPTSAGKWTLNDDDGDSFIGMKGYINLC